MESVMQPSTTALLVLLSSDLMLGSRLEAPARSAGLELATVEAPSRITDVLEQGPTKLVVLDCADRVFPLTQTLQAVRRLTPGAAVIGFYPHVDAEIGRSATEAGCDIVMPRSRFFMDMGAAIRSGLDKAAAKREHALPGEKQ
jgi:DNA-binding NarL/FixJ family response regulator